MSDGLIWETEKGTFLIITVRPRSKEKSLIHSFTETELVINLQSPAREGKANSEVLKRLSKALGISSTDIVIAAGHKSKTKTLLLKNISSQSLKDKLSELHNL